MRRPSQHSIDLYNQLVKKQNAVRKILKKIHKHAEETLGVGRLPALILPKRARQIQNRDNLNLKAFWNRYRKMRDMFGNGINDYLGKVVKQGYMELWREHIGIDPEGYFGKYTPLQIREAGELGIFMEVYNKLQGLSGLQFLALQYMGGITAFKWIYDELTNGIRDKENSYIQGQLESLEKFGSGKGIIKTFYNAIGMPDPIKRRASTMRKAKALQRKYENNR